MTNDRGEVRDVSYRQLMPWTEIFRAFQLALDPSKLVLALVAVVLLWAGWAFLGLALLPAEDPNPFGVWPPNAQRGGNPIVTMENTVKGAVRDQSAKPGEGGVLSREFWLGNDSAQGPVQLEPFHKLLGPVLVFLRSNPMKGEWWFAFLGIFYSLAVWGLFAGAITRIAAVQYARKEKLGIGEALRFARSKYKSFLIAPLIPLVAILAMVVLMFLGSLMIHIPWIGILLASILWFLPLIAGLIVVIMALAYIGWPLMYATISAEGSDSFDALSRSLAYVWQRPAHYFFYFLVAVLYGILVTFLFVFVVTFVVYAAKWGVGLIEGQFSWYYSENGPAISTLFVYAPTSYHWREILTRVQTANGSWTHVTPAHLTDWAHTMAAMIMAVWMHLMFLVVVAFAYSYFWCAGTVVYFLMRRKVDDTDLDEVYLEEEEPFFMEPAAQPATPTPATLSMTEAAKTPSGDTAPAESKPAPVAEKKPDSSGSPSSTSESKP